MKTIHPSSKQLFAKPIEAETTTASGIILTQSTTFEPKYAEVINIGSEVTVAKQRDTIVYKEYATTDISLDGEDYILVNEDDVLGTIIEV